MKTDNCAVCGTDKNIQHHHFLPKSLGGSDADANFISLCEYHHNQSHGIDKRINAKELTLKGIDGKRLDALTATAGLLELYAIDKDTEIEFVEFKKLKSYELSEFGDDVLNKTLFNRVKSIKADDYTYYQWIFSGRKIGSDERYDFEVIDER